MLKFPHCVKVTITKTRWLCTSSIQKCQAIAFDTMNFFGENNTSKTFDVLFMLP